MFCEKCGAQVPDGSAVCPACGANLSTGAKVGSAVNAAAGAAMDMFGQAEQALGSAANNVSQSVGGPDLSQQPGAPLKTDRSLVMYILLTIVTCGIYGYWFVYSMARDVNIACEGDGEQTAGLVAFIVLSMVTCGFYAYYWYYKMANRLQANAPRYGLNFTENGTTVLLWCIIGMVACGVGPFVAMYILIKNTNQICSGYNRAHGFM